MISDVDTYCQLAKIRNTDNVAAISQGVLDNNKKVGKAVNTALEKTEKLSDSLMKPIGKVDRFVIERLFGACQVEIENKKGFKIGTEENKIEAGNLLTRVILETQQNSMVTERSAAMRSSSEILKTLTMFSADGMKVIGRVIDSYGEYFAIKSELKLEDITEERKNELNQKLKDSKIKIAKSNTALITSALFMATIAELFKFIYNKDREEDEKIVDSFLKDTIGNMLGGLPVIKDVYSYFVHGYEINDYNYSVVKDLLSSVNDLFNVAKNLNSTNSQDINKGIRNIVYAVSQLLGLPVRNVYNMLYGLTKRFSPSTAYKINSIFYNNSYTKDLNKALEKGDEKLASTITSIMLNERLDDSFSTKTITKLIQLNIYTTVNIVA